MYLDSHSARSWSCSQTNTDTFPLFVIAVVVVQKIQSLLDITCSERCHVVDAESRVYHRSINTASTHKIFNIPVGANLV